MAYSNSGIKSYEQCPYKYKLTRIEHRQEPTGDAAQRGKDIHYEFEQALTALPFLDEAYAFWSDYINELITYGAKSEAEFAVTKDWQPCGFKDENAWVRGIYDATYFNSSEKRAHVLDWKTGKERDYGDQLKLYATVLLASYPEIDSVSTEVCYIDLKKRIQLKTYTREQLDELKEWLTSRITKIENDDVYAPKPDYGCRWCHFRKSNGGPCQW